MVAATAPTALELDEAGHAQQEEPGHREEDEERQQPRAQQRQLLAELHVALLRRQGRAQRRVHPAADPDIGHEHRRDQQARKHAREPELADRLARDHAVEHQHDRGRHQDAEGGAGLDHAGHHDLVVAATQQFRHCDRGPDRHAGDAEAVHSRDHHHQRDRAEREPAGQAAHPDVKGAVEIRRDAALAEHVAHVDEQRQRQQRVPVHQDEGRVERHLGRAVAPEKQRRDRRDEADRCKDALPGQKHDDHAGEHRQGDQLGAHAMSLPRTRARSRRKITMVCSSIRKMPKVITILIGASNGRQADDARWPYSSA